MNVSDDSKFVESFNPATGELIGRARLHTVAELNKIIDKAQLAQIEWNKFSISERAKRILKIRDYLIENTDEIAEVLACENGKSRIEAFATEIFSVVLAISYYCKNAPKFLRDEKIKSGNIFLVNKRSKILRVPFGVVGIISPWNYPFSIPFSEIIMSLLAGNSVILKGASETIFISQQIEKAIQSAALPPNLFNILNMPGKIAGDVLLEAGVNKLFFTGSVEVGKYLMQKAAETLTPISLELGGNDPMIVCEDADPIRAAMGAVWAGFQNSGQSCAGVERIYVHEKIYDQFLFIIKGKIEQLRIGYGIDFNSDIGCMTTKKQVATVKKHIADALGKGGQIFAQSKMNKELKSENFLPAMAFVNVNHKMLLMNEESFGPIVGIMKFNSYEEAIQLANDSKYGLTASVWSKNRKFAEEIACQLKAGAIMINDHLMSHGLAETPWGGMKSSGIGRTHGKLGLHDKTQPVVIIDDLFSFAKRNLWWHPYSEKLYSQLKSVMHLLYNKKTKMKLLSLIEVIKFIPRMFKQD